MSKTEQAVDYMLQMANDNTHGYSQTYRWPEQGPSFDCSSLVISAWEYGAGVPVRTNGATYTGNMYDVFLHTGFKDVTSQCNLSNCNGMIRGDVLLNDANHTAMYIGNNKVVHARGGEGTNDTRDNSGNEIRVQAYWNYPWNHILRYQETSSTVNETESKTETEEEYVIPKPDIPYTEPVNVVNIKDETEYNELDVHVCRPGEMSWFVGGVQYLLKSNCYWCQADNKFQIETAKWVLQFQADRGLEQDAEVGYYTWNELFKDKNLRIGDVGYAVKAVQSLLRAQNYYVGDGDVDGIYGSNVFMQIRRFQEVRGLTKTGFVNKETWNELIKM